MIWTKTSYGSSGVFILARLKLHGILKRVRYCHSWTDVNSLKKGLSAIKKEILINALEEFETRRNVALHKHPDW